MKINDIYESTTSGSVAPVAMPMTGGVQSRSTGTGIYPAKKGGNLLTGKKTSKKYANSIAESKQIEEAHLDEEELIIIPGQGHKLKSGFIPHAEDRRDHEVSMARSDLFQAAKNAKQTFEMLQDVSEDQGVEGWVQAKITKAADYLATVREYLEGKQVNSMTGEGLSEGKHDSYNLRDLVNALTQYVGSKSESVLVSRLLNILRNNYADHSNNLPNREITGSELMSLYGIVKNNRGALMNFIDKVYGGPNKDDEESYSSFKFSEGAKVDRMVKHIEKSERGLGKSKDKASDIAWATLNKRGMLDNKNKK